MVARDNTEDMKTMTREQVNNLLEDFCNTTTAHGFSHLVPCKNKIVTGLWALMIIGAFCGLAFHTESVLRLYLAYEVTESYSAKLDSISFPYVTICNIQEISMHNAKMNEHILAKLNLTMNNLERDPTSDMFMRLGLQNAQLFGHYLKDLIVSCEFAGKTCEMSDFKLEQSPSYFNCFTFTGNKTIERKHLLSGPKNGLSLILFKEEGFHDLDLFRTYNPNSYIENSNGVRIVIHQENTMPDMDEEGLDIAAGFSTNIALQKQRNDRLGAPYGHCEVTPSQGSKYDVYTQAQCRYSKIHNSHKF